MAYIHFGLVAFHTFVENLETLFASVPYIYVSVTSVNFPYQNAEKKI